MKTPFLSLDIFDKAYEDLGWVDYYVIKSITDTEIQVIIYTKKPIEKEDPEFDELVIRNSSIGEHLKKEIIWDYKSTSNNKIANFLKRKLSKRDETIMLNKLNDDIRRTL